MSKEEDYNIFEKRKIKYPTSDIETLINLLKGTMGIGVLAMPLAFKNTGLLFGAIATLFVGLVCTHCVYILVKCAHILCQRHRIPSLNYAEVAEQAFLDGPEKFKKWSSFVKNLVNTFLCTALMGCCCIYLVFVGVNLKQVIDHHLNIDLNIRFYILHLTIPLIIICLVRNLKYITPLSMIANVLVFVGIIIIMYYILIDLPEIKDRPAIASIKRWPRFFGTATFSLEGIGLVLSLENEMKNPTHFLIFPSILFLGMGLSIAFNIIIGFFGYLKFGEETKGSITLNMPSDISSSQTIKIIMAISIFFTYAVQFYVPVNIIWGGIKHKFSPDHYVCGELILRAFLAIVTIAIAAALPNLEPLITLIGAVCFSTLGLIIPPIIELSVYYIDPRLGSLKFRLWKNSILIIFGIIGLISGVYVTVLMFNE